MAADAHGAEDDVATAALLLNAAGLRRGVFPKTYHIRVSTGFCIYLLLITVFVFAYTGYLYSLPENDVGPIIFLFDVAYVGIILLVIFLQVPRRVVREDDRLLIVFCCRTRVVPIHSIIEVRIVRRRRFCQGGRQCAYPTKCFWGYPTNFDRNIIVVTDTCCNNYFFCLKEMDEFLADNWPEAVGDEAGISAQARATAPESGGTSPAVLGSAL